MRKSLVFLVAAVSAVMVQAAALDWSIAAKVVTPSATGTASAGRASFYTALVFTSDQSEAVNGLLTAKSGVNFAGLAEMAKSSYQAGKVGSFGGSVSGLQEKTSVTLFAVVFDTQTADAALSSAKYYQITSGVSGNTYAGTDAPSTAAFTASQVNNKWISTAGSPEPMPEPTSGLLLMVGGALLALRRKQK